HRRRRRRGRAGRDGLVADVHQHAGGFTEVAGAVAHLDDDRGHARWKFLGTRDHQTILHNPRTRGHEGGDAKVVDRAGAPGYDGDLERTREVVQGVADRLCQSEIGWIKSGYATLGADARVAVAERPRGLNLQVGPGGRIGRIRIEHHRARRTAVGA